MSKFSNEEILHYISNILKFEMNKIPELTDEQLDLECAKYNNMCDEIESRGDEDSIEFEALTKLSIALLYEKNRRLFTFIGS